MKRATLWIVIVLCFEFVVPGMGTGQGFRTFTGAIGDSACGLTHMMPAAPPAQCTIECVQRGAKFVLTDAAHHRVYALSDQEKVRAFAGQMVTLTGTVKGTLITVESVAALKPAGPLASKTRHPETAANAPAPVRRAM